MADYDGQSRSHWLFVEWILTFILIKLNKINFVSSNLLKEDFKKPSQAT